MSVARDLERHNPIDVNCWMMPQRCCRHSFSILCLVALQPAGAWKHIYRRICIPMISSNFDTREHSKIHTMDSCTDLPGTPCTFFDSTSQGCSPSFRGSEAGAYLGVDFPLSFPLWRKLELSPLEHCPAAFHWKHSPGPHGTPLLSLRVFTTAPVSFLSFLAWKFRDFILWSMLLFTVVFNFW